MSDALTLTGLDIDAYLTRFERVAAALRGAISDDLDLSPSAPTGQMVAIPLEHIQQILELHQAAYAALDPAQASGRSLEAVSAMTGSYRRDATFGSTTLTCTFAAPGGTAPAGSIVATSADPDNRWVLDAAATVVGAGSVDVAATAESAGRIEAPASTIDTIVTPAVNWTTVDNAAAATPGEEVETDEDFRLRRASELALGGSTTVDAIRAELTRSDGLALQYAQVYENDRWYTVDGRPEHCFEVVWFNGASWASDDNYNLVASAIWGVKPAGIYPHGHSLLSTLAPPYHVDEQGRTHEVRHTEATTVAIKARWTITWDAGLTIAEIAVLTAEIQDAAEAYVTANFGVGDTVRYFEMAGLPLTIDGVAAVDLYEQALFAGVLGTADIPMAYNEIATLDPTDVDVI